MRPTTDLKLLEDVRGQLDVQVHDGTTQGMIDLVARVKPDLAYHVASRFVSQHVSADVEPLVLSNVLFGAQLAEALAVQKVPHLVNIGTSWQNYEDREYSPVCLYAATKQAMEAMLQFYVETGRLRVTTLRLFDTYGPGDPRPKLLSLLRRIADTGATLDMSPGGQLQDIVFIDDVVDALLLAGDRMRKGPGAAAMQVFAVSSGKPVPLKELVAAFADAYGRPVSIRWGGKPYREREVMVPWSLGTPVPGWSPRVSLEEGLRRTLGTHV